jgi:uncharacterized membrane protein YfcA
MDATIFLIATFAGALVAGLSGFAFGLVAASIWLYILTPLQTATLIVAFGLIVQGYSVWRLRHALEWAKLWPFILGAAIGVPVGTAILGWANPSHVRAGIGVFLVIYSLYVLFRPKTASAAFLTYAALDPVEGYTSADFQAAIAALPHEGLQEVARALSQALESAGGTTRGLLEESCPTVLATGVAQVT